MAEVNRMNNKFEDIEMLELPDDDNHEESLSSSSETEGISTDSSDSMDDLNTSQRKDQDSSSDQRDKDQSNSIILSMLNENQDYPELSQWLNSKEILHYRYNPKKYNYNLPMSELDRNYTSYLENNFKTIEQLISDIHLVEQNESDSQPIGLITNSIKTPTFSKNQFINESFDKIIENLNEFIKQSYSLNHDFKNQLLLMLLVCLQSTEFFSNVKEIPELTIKWVNMFDPEPSVELIDEVMINHSPSYTHPLFWNTLLAKMVCRGLFQQIDETLEHSNYAELKETDNTMFEVISDLRQLLSDYSIFASKGQFAQWKLSACEFRDSISFVKETVSNNEHKIILSQIYDIACIMTGFTKTISSYCETWYEIYLAFSLYQIRDNVEIYEEFFQKAINEKPPSAHVFDGSSDKDLEDMTESGFVNIFEKNYIKVLQVIFLFDPATAAYISLLLELKGILSSYYSVDINMEENLDDIFNKKTISEYFILRHAYNCLNVQSLVPIGVGLLSNEILNTSSHKMSRNKSTIAQFLPHYKIDLNDDLEWALTICADLSLISTARSIYYQAGIHALENNYLYDALNNFVNCYDPEKTSGSYHTEGMQKIHYIIWDIIFTDCLVNNKPIEDEILNDVVDQKMDGIKIHPIIQQCISPYAVLKEFYDSLSRDSPHEMMHNFSKIVHLLKFEYLPMKFKPLLLSQILLFLNDNSPLQLPDLIVIIEMIDNYETESSQSEKEEGEQIYTYSTTNFDDHVDDNDWRKAVGKIPKDVNSLIKLLRNKVTVKIGLAFIE
ncbi:NUP85 [Candida pseudojiufengensis]|uniref:NUP85 n=1 Tax=Candida pseudojiufengensis TaxID=497109 RepID=UPI0022250E30|nr:NUP85 [Candida pseudojiufengensis]KAI5966898.1 NUP85 [Candida pseudojiufengensis]